MAEKVNYDDLICRYINQFDNTFSFLDRKKRDDKISLTDPKNDEANFKSDLNEIKKGNKKHRSKEQKHLLCSIEMVYKKRSSVIEFFDNYSSMVSEAKLKVIKGTRIKILTPKQTLPRLPIALAQVKAGNISENLLNEIR